MANSTVQYENLDEEFPVDTDNDPGFRDNFPNNKNSITKCRRANRSSLQMVLLKM